MKACGGSRPGTARRPRSERRLPRNDRHCNGGIMTERRRHSRSEARFSTAPEPERVFLVAVEIKGHDGWSTQSSLDELALLADTAGALVVGRTSQKLDHPHPATYVGKGKLDEIAATRSALNFTTVIFDDELTPSQQRNLEDALKIKVIDRTALILDIFAARA